MENSVDSDQLASLDLDLQLIRTMVITPGPLFFSSIFIEFSSCSAHQIIANLFLK